MTGILLLVFLERLLVVEPRIPPIGKTRRDPLFIVGASGAGAAQSTKHQMDPKPNEMPHGRLCVTIIVTTVHVMNGRRAQLAHGNAKNGMGVIDDTLIIFTHYRRQ